MSPRLETPTMLHWRAALAALALAATAMAPLAARAQNAIQSITSSQQAGTEVVRIELSEALATVPNGFSVQAPPRIAIDLPGVANKLGRNNVEVNQGNLRSVAVATSGAAGSGAAAAAGESIPSWARMESRRDWASTLRAACSTSSMLPSTELPESSLMPLALA